MRRIGVVLMAAALGLSAPPAVFAPPAQAQTGGLNVRDADIRAFIQDVARVTGRTFIIDPRVRGTVSVVSEERLTPNELLEVLLSTLRANGLVAIPTAGGGYRIAPEEGAAQQPGGAGGGGGGGGIAGFATEVFRLGNISAAAAADALRPLVGRQGVVTASPQGNSLIVSDYADNLGRIRGLIAQLDQSRAATQTVTLQNSSAQEIAGVINGLLNPPGAPPSARNPLVSLVVVDSSNSLILRGDPATVSQLLPVIADLDRRAQASEDVRVVRLQHADAEQLLPVLQQIVGAPVTQPTPQPGPVLGGRGSPSFSQQPQQSDFAPPQPAPAFSGAPASAGAPAGSGAPRANIARYPGQNALVIAADPTTQRLLADIIRQLDTRREQVLVEAIVVEISDTAAQQLGVQFLLAGADGSAPFTVTNYSNSAPNILALTGAVAGANVLGEDSATLQQLRDVAVNSLLGTSGFLGGGGGLINDDALFGFIVNAVKRDAASNLLSTPFVFTLDNEPATILVGQEVPVTVGEVLGDANSNPFRTIQRRDVGILLEVRPQINAGGAITLSLRQEVSSVAASVAGIDELIFNKRAINTKVLVDDGDIIVLGGLVDQNDRITVEKVPVLGDIPVVGNLFRSRGRERGRTNLMVFIRPSIVRTTAEARTLTAPRYDYIRGEQFRSEQAGGARPGAPPSLDALVRDYMRANPPLAAPPLVPPLAAPPAPSAPVPSAPPPARPPQTPGGSR